MMARKKMQKILSLLTAFSMLMSLMSVSALADEGESGENAETKEPTVIRELVLPEELQSGIEVEYGTSERDILAQLPTELTAVIEVPAEEEETTDDAAGAATDDAAGAATDDAAGAATDDAAGAATDDAAGAATDDAAGETTGESGSWTGTLNFNDANPNADTAETKVSVSWSCTTGGGFDEWVAGDYTFTAALNESAEDYTYVGDAADLPTVTVTVEEPEGGYEASIGDTMYEKLDAALAAAVDGDTIEVLSNCRTLKGIGVPATTLTVDGNGHRILFPEYGIYIVKNNGANKPGVLNLVDCKIEMNPAKGTPMVWGEGYGWANIVINYDCELNLTDSTMTMEATTPGTGVYYHEGSKVNLDNSTMIVSDLKSSAFSADVNDKGEVYTSELNVLNGSRLETSGCYAGFTAALQITVDDSVLIDSNQRGNASNGADYIIKNYSTVDISGNGSNGMSARHIYVENSTLTCNDNGMRGIIFYGNAEFIKSNVTIKGTKGTTYWCAGMRLSTASYRKAIGYMDKDSTLTITDNLTTGIFMDASTQLTIEEGANVLITRNRAEQEKCSTKKDLAQKGGGLVLRSGAVATMSASTKIYNNQALLEGDDIYMEDGGILTFSDAQSSDKLILTVRCDEQDEIDGWYDDVADARWDAHNVPRHIIQYTDFDNDTMLTVTGPQSMKAAHGIVIPELPSNAETQAPTVAKVATELTTDTKQTDVTLEVNGSEGRDSIAVMFLLDKSTSQGTARQNAAQMLQTLKSKTNTNILYDVVIFSGSASSTGWCDIKDDAALENTLVNFANKETTGGTNLLAGIYQAQEDLAKLPEAYQDCAYLVTISDGITYVWDNSTISDSGVVSKSGDGEVMSMVADQIADGGKNHHVNNTMTTWDILHGLGVSVSDVYGSYASFLKAVPTKLANTEKYLIPYGTAATAENVLPVYTDNMAAAEANYACGAEFAMYYSTYAYADLAQSFARVFTLPMPEISNGTERSDWDNYPCGEEMMLYLQNAFSTNATQGAVHDADSEKIFAEIGDQILYSIQSGTVTDVIGSNFDLADVNSFMLTIGGEVNKENGQLTGGTQVTAKTVEGNTVTFGNGKYVVTYYPATENEAEHFVWAINTPVTSAGSLHLTYTLVLAGTFDDGTYGEYDADGSERYENLLTNESAKLEYTSTADGSKGSINFPKPTVQYKQESSGENPGSSTGGSKMRVTATKVWSGDDDADRPSSVKVQLLKDGKEHATATLKASNDWTYKWTGLSKTYTWTVKEVDVADGYTDSYKSVMKDDVKTITITNTYEAEEITDPETPLDPGTDPTAPGTPGTPGIPGTDIPEENPPKADAPQTGDTALMWVLAAAASGIGLVWLTISGKKRKDETAE